MAQPERTRLIESYFDALDEEDPAILEPSLSDAFVYESLSETFEGFEGFRTYMTEYRSFSNTDHQLEEMIHGERRTAVEGVVVGRDDADEEIEARFCDVFVFDDEGIARIAVYMNDYIDLTLFRS